MSLHKIRWHNHKTSL